MTIKKVNDLAFGQENEGNLVEKLRKNQDYVPELSLVAEVENFAIALEKDGLTEVHGTVAYPKEFYEV